MLSRSSGFMRIRLAHRLTALAVELAASDAAADKVQKT